MFYSSRMSVRRAGQIREFVAQAPALVSGAREAVWCGGGGPPQRLTPAGAAALARAGPPPLLCHLPATAQRLGGASFAALDVLELFAFVRPAQFCVPTPRGLATAVGLAEPDTLEDQAESLCESALELLALLGRSDYPDRAAAAAAARAMARQGWSWGAAVTLALGTPPRRRFDVIGALPEWSDGPPPAPPGHLPVAPAEARSRLAALLGPGAEARPQQADYASAASAAFAAREKKDNPHIVLAEAGTGVGKTLGYIAPASVWVEKNDAPVWISTYTKNLQRQIDRELDRLYPDAEEKRRRVVVRKGRENYLCLLNFADAGSRHGMRVLPGIGGPGVGHGLIARWVAHTRDGDMVGGDFPGWLADLAGRQRTGALTDRRGECVHSACTHWRKCFIEQAARRARQADLVIANHALVLSLAVSGDGDPARPRRLVFDEGHHLFDAADSAFSLHLSGLEARELRRWLRGAEMAQARARGLRSRVGDLVAEDDQGAEALAAVLAAAQALPGEEWLGRVAGKDAGRGPCEVFLACVHRQVSARATDSALGFGLETDVRPPVEGLPGAAERLDEALKALSEPMAALEAVLEKRLDEDGAHMDKPLRTRFDAAVRALRRRRTEQVAAWRAMLQSLAGEPDEAFTDWFAISRRDGRDSDVGMRRHWVDPTEPFARAVLTPLHGALITSATLRDAAGGTEAAWRAAEERVGARHLEAPALRAAVPSPFDYAAQTRAFIVTDVNRDSTAQVAAACRALFCAAGGGALGLFTAIWRLRQVHGRLARPLEEAGLVLLAQHVDRLDPATLVDIFRAERHACLLGTDALRDGVDVPGDALRLIAFDRVPWPRPDLLHKARRKRFGAGWDDRMVRLRLRQAFGRLVRRADDTGVFVMLDSRMPSRLLDAFPEGVPVRRVGLAEAVAEAKEFLSGAPHGLHDRLAVKI